jgi:hypothetical protein
LYGVLWENTGKIGTYKNREADYKLGKKANSKSLEIM